MVNFKELEKLKRRVLRYPEQYRQEYWGYGGASDVVEQQKPACGTAGCLAYNVVAGNGYTLGSTLKVKGLGETAACFKKGEGYSIKGVAQEILQLNPYQADELFGGGMHGWSPRSRQKYKQAKTPRERAEAAAMAIDDFAAKYRAIEAYGRNELIEMVKLLN